MPYKKFFRRNYFYGLPVLFSRWKKKDPLAILHKIRDRKDPSNHVYLTLFFSTSWSRSLPCEVVCVTHDKVLLLFKSHWIDWISLLITLFGLLILDLFQFYTLKKLVGMYQKKKIVGSNNNCAVINNWIKTWDMRQSDHTKNHLNGTVFTGHL